MRDRVVFRPAEGRWWLLFSGTGHRSWLDVQWGAPGDVPVPGDCDGDGQHDFAVYRPADGSWWVLFQSFYRLGVWEWTVWGGLAGDVPAPKPYMRVPD